MIGQYLREACQTVPGETFLATPDRQYTYREAAATVAGLATWLQCRKTTRLLLYLRDSPELIFLLFAGSLAGCQTGVANRRSSPKELAELCRRFGFEQILADDAIAVPGISVERWPDWKAGSSPEACVDALEDNSAGRIIILTTGTTGQPKGAMYRWRDLTRQIRRKESLDARVMLLAYQLNHFAGFQMVLHTVVNQATLVIPNSLQLADVLPVIQCFGVTAISATPTFWRLMCNHLIHNPQALSLKQITVGGEAVTEDVLRKLAICFPGVPVSQIYASTEMGSCFSVRDGKVGFPVELLNRCEGDVQLRIIEGELHVRSAYSMLGYAGADQQQQSEWFPTGDLVSVRNDRVEFLGRKSEIINVGGVKVQPLEVESVIAQVEGVVAVRVLAKRNPITGQIVTAQVVPASAEMQPRIESDIRAACQQLDRYKQPRLIEFVAELPLANQKILRHSVEQL